ncbi:RES family NAD+ phosphorylase [Bosea sp. 2RAB26]|uniref:RES family NAD+ phosphorylase n=1 Tax=Bosea sp. 2RAB26 TaxID=3237476 RepID=UPI003F902796
MKVWRVCRLPFADLNGEGARIYGGRWNTPGRPLLYTAENPALAVLEVRVHLDLEPDLIPDDYVLMEIESGSAVIKEILDPIEAPATVGDRWLASMETPILKVPSFVVPNSFNLLINPAHPGAASISIQSTKPFDFDRRLWLPLTYMPP